ncbi:uncharacterized protein LOC110457056 [Mizuhopecten yessoensis]|uniref:uncharacterized protein LOC110457056 n=1 Tax=Mizuhopecten yessoensis TaxID=6573 RepID=UPI000B45CFFE|nr:uncharacterized protein LOC110457056 [Mizuhopecten yessoensis]
MDIITKQVIDIIKDASDRVTPLISKVKRGKRHVWNPEIATVTKANKTALKQWKDNEKPTNGPIAEQRRVAKKELLRHRRIEIAHEFIKDVMEANRGDKKTFYRLINRLKTTPTSTISELKVGDKLYSNPADILHGWKEHFTGLITPSPPSNPILEREVVQTELDIDTIKALSQEQCLTAADMIVPRNVEEAMGKLNTNKAVDIFHLTAEHLKFGGVKISDVLTTLFNLFLDHGKVPDCLKLGQLVPIFKKKGEKKDSKNYRGITVLSVILKTLETVIRASVQTVFEDHQSPLQRGFTK